MTLSKPAADQSARWRNLYFTFYTFTWNINTPWFIVQIYSCICFAFQCGVVVNLPASGDGDDGYEVFTGSIVVSFLGTCRQKRDSWLILILHKKFGHLYISNLSADIISDSEKSCTCHQLQTYKLPHNFSKLPTQLLAAVKSLTGDMNPEQLYLCYCVTCSYYCQLMTNGSIVLLDWCVLLLWPYMCTTFEDSVYSIRPLECSGLLFTDDIFHTLWMNERTRLIWQVRIYSFLWHLLSFMLTYQEGWVGCDIWHFLGRREIWLGNLRRYHLEDVGRFRKMLKWIQEVGEQGMKWIDVFEIWTVGCNHESSTSITCWKFLQ